MYKKGVVSKEGNLGHLGERGRSQKLRLGKGSGCSRLHSSWGRGGGGSINRAGYRGHPPGGGGQSRHSNRWRKNL